MAVAEQGSDGCSAEDETGTGCGSVAGRGRHE